MNLYSIPPLPVLRRVIGRGVILAILGLLALDGGLWITSASAALQLSPSSLTFTAQQNGANPAPQTINLSKSGTFMRSWTVNPSVSWLTVSPTSGTLSTETDLIVVGANVAGLGQGSYPASITVTTVSKRGGVSKITIPVSLSLTASTSSGTIGSLPSNLAFAGTVGGTNPAAQPFTLTNSGGGTLSWTISNSAGWLQLSTASGTTTTETDNISASVTTSGLAAGIYNGFITVTAPGSTNSPRQIPVSLTLTAATLAPAIGLNQSSLGFAGTVGGTNPAAKTFSITNTGGGTLLWTVSGNAAWLALSPVSGTNSGTVAASVNLTGLAAGTYNATVSVTATGATTKTIPIALTVSPTGSATGFNISPPTLAYTATVGSPNKPGSVTVTNTGSTAITVTWADSINWLVAITPGVTQTIQPGLSGTFALTASFTNLAAGSYSGTATISGGGITKQVPVTLTLTAVTSTPTIGLNTTSLGFAGTVGGTNPSAQTIGISNTGGGTLSWAVSDNATWLTLSPLSGTNAGTVTATVNLAGLLSGSYAATVTVTATGATPKTLSVTLTVTGSTSGGTIGFSPANLAFSGTVGGTNPATKTFSITNTGGGTLSWTLSDNATWLQLNTASGTTTSETDTISASTTLSGLAAGTYNATISITASGSTNSPQQIPVSLTLNATAAGTANLTWNASTESDLAGYKVYRGTASGTYGAPLTTLPKTTASYTTTGLQTGTTYFFAITSYDSSGNESAFSNEVSKSIF